MAGPEMTDRAAQLRAGAARSREAKRQAGLRPHEHWYRDDEAPAVAEFFRALAAARAPEIDIPRLRPVVQMDLFG
jgi:N-acetyl-beta-hexosaminidase